MNESVIKFNINDYVWVKLTDVGRKLLKEHHRLKEHHEKFNKLMESCGEASFNKLMESCGEASPPYQPPIEIDGWSKWQMRDLFHQLGGHLKMGFDLPFASNILLEDRRDK